MAQNLDQTAGTGRPASIVAVFADRNAADAAARAMQDAGVDGGSIHDAGGSGGPAHPALARLPDADRQAVSSALAAQGVVLVVTGRSQAEHDLALAVLGRQADDRAGATSGGQAPAPSAAGDATALPEGIRGTTRDVAFTEPKDEHAGYGDSFPDRMRDSAPARGPAPGLYIVRGA